MKYAAVRNHNPLDEKNKLYPEDRAVHDWYRFVLSFPAHLVQEYLERFCINSSHQVLDPFCGTGTVLVECKKRGFTSYGIEANPMAHFATRIKIDWDLEPDGFLEHARKVAAEALALLRADGIEDTSLLAPAHSVLTGLRTLPTEEMKLLLTNSMSPLPLHKTLVLLACIKKHFHERFSQHELLALGKSTVFSSSNLRFGPEVGLGLIKSDAPVIAAWLQGIQAMVTDLRLLQKGEITTPSQVYLADSRHVSQILAPESIDAVITSPPYPNEKDYTRTTRLESVLLGFIHSKEDLQSLKKMLLCSNTRNVYVGDTDDTWVREYRDVTTLAELIEGERVRLGKTSGFEKLYAKVTKLYFGGMARHLAFLRPALRPGAHLAYVVGDQASYFRVMIPTGKILAEIAQSLGYECVGRELFRTRFSTTTKEQLGEEVVILRWPGHISSKFPVLSPLTLTQNVRNYTMQSLFPEDEDQALTDNSLTLSENQQEAENDVIELSSPSPQKLNRYQRLLEYIFHERYKEGDLEVLFERQDLETTAQFLSIKLPKNLGDVIYSFRYRTVLPASIREKAPEGKEWTISPSGRSRYCFVAKTILHIKPHPLLTVVKIPDATPGMVAKYAQGDEQALLTKLRYNRLVDIFTRVTCYSLQNHLRTSIQGIGQIETDEIYVGLDRNGIQYVFPLQAKGGTDKIGITQIEQDIALCAVRFPQLVCRPLAAQFTENDRIALFEFSQDEDGVRLHREVHYRLVPHEQMTEEDLRSYRNSSADSIKD